MRGVRLVHRQHVDLFFAMHGVPQRQARTQLQIARLEGAFEQQHRPAPTQCPHALGLGQVQERKAIDTTEGVKNTLNAMPIGIRLDHAPHARIACGDAQTREVVTQGVGMDRGLYRAWHDVQCDERGSSEELWHYPA